MELFGIISFGNLISIFNSTTHVSCVRPFLNEGIPIQGWMFFSKRAGVPQASPGMILKTTNKFYELPHLLYWGKGRFQFFIEGPFTLFEKKLSSSSSSAFAPSSSKIRACRSTVPFLAVIGLIWMESRGSQITVDRSCGHFPWTSMLRQFIIYHAEPFLFAVNFIKEHNFYIP